MSSKKQLEGTGITFEGWYPLGHGDRKLLEEPILTKLAAKYGKATAQIILRWHLQEGNVTIPKSLNPQHMRDNLSIFDFTLTDGDMDDINNLPQNPYYQVPEEPPAFTLTHNDYSQQA